MYGTSLRIVDGKLRALLVPTVSGSLDATLDLSSSSISNTTSSEAFESESDPGYVSVPARLVC